MMFGKSYNSMSKMWFEYPCISTGGYLKSVRTYYLITLGYHLNAMRVVIWAYFVGKSKNDWIEMSLHHMLTIVLYMVSYKIEFIKIGALIMFVHDWADIWSPFAKIWVETNYKNLTIFGAFMTWTVWVYSRLYVFP